MQAVIHPILAIDYGDARVGLACTDMVGIAVHPLETVPRDAAVEMVKAVIRTKAIKQIVVGIPLLRDGFEGDSAQKARAFMELVYDGLGEIPIDYIDESFSTVEAATQLSAAGLNAKKQKGVIDQVAAMEILHRWLEQSGESFRGMDGFPETEW